MRTSNFSEGLFRGKINSEVIDDRLKCSLYHAKKQSLADLKEELKSLFGSEDQVKAIVCIDELDRCRPDYAINYLETIKHVFDIPGIVFVLAIDKDQVANSARSLFGSDLNANEY